MKTVLLISTIQFLMSFAWAGELTTELVPLNQLAKKFVADVERIEVYYPKQFERLEMNWKKTSAAYVRQYEQEKDLEKKFNIFGRLYNSWNNAHHKPMTVKGYVKDDPKEILELPVRFFGQGLKMSQVRVFIDDVSKFETPADINVGDEVLQYNGLKLKDYTLLARDEQGSESPESHIATISRDMALQRRCRWGKLHCWSLKEPVQIVLKDVITGQNKSVILNWRARVKNSFAGNLKEPLFVEDDKSWSYKPLLGSYGIDFDSVPDNEFGFYGALQNGSRKWLLIKIFQFSDIAFIQSAIQEARKSDYEGVVLDFSDNGGGKDSAMTFMAGILGTKYQLELSSIRLVKEFKDYDVLKEAVFGSTKADYLFNLVKTDAAAMSPLMPFACLDKTCPMKTSFSDYLNYWDKPSVLTDVPIKKIALITGRGTASKTDSVAALFRSTKAGPILGTPAVASSGTYYFRKEYLVQTGKNVVTVGVTFTPDFSLGGDCEEIQANPPEPDVLIERTLQNRKYYDTHTWVEATKALTDWKRPSEIEKSCGLEEAHQKMKQFGLR